MGGHVGPDSPKFLRKYVVPLLHRHDRGEDAGLPENTTSRAAPPDKSQFDSGTVWHGA
jgi:hypothetical protein